MKEAIWDRFFRMTNYVKNADVLIRYFYGEFALSLPQFHAYINRINEEIKKSKDTDLASRYLTLFSPLCERFGMFAIKNELDDICFFILYPSESKRLLLDLEKFEKKHQKFLDFTLSRLKALMKDDGLVLTVMGRKKTLYSLFSKMNRKNIKSVADVTDLVAFRMITEDNHESTCFRVLNIVHDSFYPVVDRFKDYITIPKINGYQSVHTGVIIEHDGEGMLVEIQICTAGMYEIGEQGFSSHFLYKKNSSRTHTLHRDRLLLEVMQGNLHQSQQSLLAITYSGDVIALNKGDTLLDFAYRIHSDVGNFAKSGFINDKPASLFSPIDEGDVIRVLLSDEKQVTSAWISQTKNTFTLKKIHESVGR